MSKRLLLCVIFLLFGFLSNSFATTIGWTDWIGSVGSGGSIGNNTYGGYGGNIGSIDVIYSGEIYYTQTQSGGGTNYWTEGTPAPYTGNSIVDNAPTASEMIALKGTSLTNTVTFSEYVLNPVMAIFSLGAYDIPVSYDFDTSFSVLSEGQGYYGYGSYNLLPGDILQGSELNAVIQFDGLINSFSWAVDREENWHGFTVGVLASAPAPVPEPSTIVLMGIGLVGLAGFGRKKIMG